MQAILWDVIRADAFTTEYTKPDSSKNASEENVKLQKAIFAKHRISREDFYNSFNYYKMNSGLMKVILDSIINKANRERVNNILIKPLTGTEK